MASKYEGANNPRDPETGLHARLLSAARTFNYPPTPHLAAKERLRVQALAKSKMNGRDESAGSRRANSSSAQAVRGRWVRIGWALAVIILLASLLLASPVRARVIEWLRLGAVRLFLRPEATLPVPNQLDAISNLAGETTLTQAAQQAPFPLMLPAYPPDLKEPQHVYLQQIKDTAVVIYVWLKPDAPEEVRLALYQIGLGDVYQKQLMRDVQETFVNGLWALWVEGPYLLTTTGGDVEKRRIVQGHTLIWSSGMFTFRLETDLSLEEARKIAESLKEWTGK